MTTIEIIFLAIAIAFIILVIFLSMMSITALKTFQQINQTLSSLQKQIDALDHAPRTFLNHANEISANLNYKMRCLDPAFRSIQNLGEKMECQTSKSLLLKRISDTSTDTTFENVSEVIELVLKGFSLWQKFKIRS